MSTESPTKICAHCREAIYLADGVKLWMHVRTMLIVCDCVTEAAPTSVGADAAQMKSDIDKFWQMLDRAWDIEPREYFEKGSRTNGFDSPLAMAAHYMWKRETKAPSYTVNCPKCEAVVDLFPAIPASPSDAAEICEPDVAGLSNKIWDTFRDYRNDGGGIPTVEEIEQLIYKAIRFAS